MHQVLRIIYGNPYIYSKRMNSKKFITKNVIDFGSMMRVKRLSGSEEEL